MSLLQIYPALQNEFQCQWGSHDSKGHLIWSAWEQMTL